MRSEIGFSNYVFFLVIHAAEQKRQHLSEIETLQTVRSKRSVGHILPFICQN